MVSIPTLVQAMDVLLDCQELFIVMLFPLSAAPVHNWKLNEHISYSITVCDLAHYTHDYTKK